MLPDEVMEEIRPRLVKELAELYPQQKEWTEADYFALPETNRLQKRWLPTAGSAFPPFPIKLP